MPADGPFDAGVIDYGQHAFCACPRAWWGVVPPPCPIHSPPAPTYTLTNTSGAGRLSDEDVERIAQRVAEKLRAG